MSYLQENRNDDNDNDNIWRNISINEGNFEFNPNEDDKSTLDNDNLSFTATTTTNFDSSMSENTSYDTQISPFIWDDIAFQNAQDELLQANNRDSDRISWEDLEMFETESTITKVTTYSEYEREEEVKYPLDENKAGSLTPYVVIDIIDGEIMRCSKESTNQRPLAQLIGTWEIDGNTFTNMKDEDKLHTLGVCSSHFTFDQNILHKLKLKQERSVEESWIYHRRCLFCNKHKYFFSRGSNCAGHSVCIIGKNIQVPCIGLKVCSVFGNINDDDLQSNNIDIISKSNSKYRTRYVCSQCFNSEGGHLFERQGSGKKQVLCENKHKNDTTKALELLGQWILNIAASEKEDQKEELLVKLSSTLTIFDQLSRTKTQSSSDQFVQNPPSLFLVKTALRVGGVNLTKIMDKSYNFTSETSKLAGERLGLTIWKSQKHMYEKRQELENPTSLKNYQSSFPFFLFQFFNGLISILERRKNEVVNKKRRQRNQEEKPLDAIHIEKISTFFVSMILSIAFPNLNIWLTHIMSSLCRKPKLISSLYAILHSANVISHTQSHERRLEKSRISKTNPKERILSGENLWNISVIDNIDFKEKTFAYGNIFDTTRNTSHATLRMIFQFLLPEPLEVIINDNKDNDSNDNILFGESEFTHNLLKDYEKIFNELLQISKDWDIKDFYSHGIIKAIQIGCQNILPPNVVILEPGDNPNCDENVHKAVDMYFNDLEFSNNNDNNNLYIACDEAIFRRLLSYQEGKSNIKLLLGQWHTSKDMCSALITIFSGYGIFNLAADLGVRYLDKLDKVVDYSATCRVLELIWIAVGIAITQYLNTKNLTMKDIENGNNQIVKVWYYYFCWAGYFFGHKIGIRRGNYNMQFKNLAAFSPLFPVAGKSNYARSVTYFLSQTNNDPILQKLLQYVCSVNLTREEHFFGFDEALERFGVKFVKQNISGNYMDNDELKAQISSVQAERDRLTMLLSEYVGDDILIKEDRAVRSRKESLWKLAEELTNAFNLDNPLTHKLFQNTKELNEEGFQRLFTCYNKGIDRLKLILYQDVYKTIKRDTAGRRKKNIIPYKPQNLQIEVENNKGKTKADDNSGENSNIAAKRPYRKTSDTEKKILEKILAFNPFPIDEAFIILEELQKESMDWDLARIKTYWANHHIKRK